MEPRFGHDFGRVRVHADSEAADSARELGALAYTVQSHVVLGAGQQGQTRESQRLLAHELTHVVQQSRAGAQYVNASSISIGLTSKPGTIQRTPDTGKKPPAPKPKHSLKLQIKIADDTVVIEEGNNRRYGGLFKNMPKDLSKRLIDQVKARLSFLSDEGFQVSVEFGKFKQSELTVPGNIQVWLVDELYESTQPGQIMKESYRYKDAAAQDINEKFTNVRQSSPSTEVNEVGGITPDQIDDSVPGTSEPVFVKISQLFSRDELSHYKQGNKQEAELRVDEISATASHELGHVLRSEPDPGHAKGNFNPPLPKQAGPALPRRRKIPPNNPSGKPFRRNSWTR